MFTLNTLQGVAFAAAGEPFVRRLRRAAFSSLIAQPAAFFEAPGNAAGRIAASLGIDAAKLKLALGPRLGEKVGSLSTLVAGVIVCFVASWELTLVIAAMMPFVVLVRLTRTTLRPPAAPATTTLTTLKPTHDP